MIRTVPAERPLPFDPKSPGARRLMAMARASVPVDIVMTKGMYVRADEVYVAGDHLTAAGRRDSSSPCLPAGGRGETRPWSPASAAGYSVETLQ